MTLVRELLELPETVRKGDFVLSLSDGVSKPEETVKSYAITPALTQAFERALSIVDSGIKSGRSQASYIHGSFGSGKSHFMAVLDLMLQGNKAVWTRSEFHALKVKYPWLEAPKVLQLPMHMIGSETLEQKVFSSYVAFVKKNHPDANIPALYADQELFENAATLRKNMEDEKFFSVLNTGLEGGGWGKRVSKWDAAAFEAALSSDDKDVREKLFGQLVKTHFPAFLGQTHKFIDFDLGLGVVSRHAATLGYKAVVLYLDELILWLAGKASDIKFVQDEAQKLAKLKEAQDEQRTIPIVSFVARQRDLAELVGDKAAGETRTTLNDSLAWSKGRFETVVLEDRNLPAVVEHRVVRPKDAYAKAQLDDQFVKVRKGLGPRAWGTLLGAHGEEPDFRRVYPFTPALMDALVAVSDCLQRERTAIRVLMELLVEHLKTLELGQVVPIGDIWDILSAGDDAFDPVMQTRFNRAKDLYAHHLLPIIQDKHQTASREKCQRLRPEHPPYLGCSDCPQRACRNDNRLAKTLLLAAFVPNAAPFKNLTVTRLVDLNPGTVMAPIPGTEASMVTGSLRDWATKLGQLRVGEQSDAEVSIRLEGVDLTPILQQAQEADTPGAKKKLLQDILFKALELPTDGQSVVATEIKWRGTKRTGKVRFANVRTLTDEQFKCPQDALWQLIVDYPFDDPEYTPQDDLDRLDKARDALTGPRNPSLVWLPSFFSDKVERELGQLCVLNHVLSGDNTQKYLGHLRPEDMSRARMDLDSLRNQKSAMIRRALEQAYGLTAVTDTSVLDATRSVEEHVVPVANDLKVPKMIAVNFLDAMSQLADRLLDFQFPHHPKFADDVTPGKMEKLRALVERLMEQHDHRMSVDKTEHKLLKDFAQPLGLLSLAEVVVQLDPAALKQIEQRRAQANVDGPTVEQVRHYADPARTMGLPTEVVDLIVYTYAAYFGRSFQRGGVAYDVDKLGKIPDDVELVKPELPEADTWHKAIEQAGAFFGVTVTGKALNARNLNEFGRKLNEAVGKLDAARGLPAQLQVRTKDWVATTGEPPRLNTAKCAAQLVAGLTKISPLKQVHFLAQFIPVTSQAAVTRSLADAHTVHQLLCEQARWINFASVRALLDDPNRKIRAQEVLDKLQDGLESDQLNVNLKTRLDELTQHAEKLLTAPGSSAVTPPPVPGWKMVVNKPLMAEGSSEAAQAALAGQIAAVLKDLGLNDGVRLELQLRVMRKEGGK